MCLEAILSLFSASLNGAGTTDHLRKFQRSFFCFLGGVSRKSSHNSGLSRIRFIVDLEAFISGYHWRRTLASVFFHADKDRNFPPDATHLELIGLHAD